MSSKYIDRRAIADKLSHCINRIRKQHGPFDRYADGFDTAVDIVLKAPTATDVVKVVRCSQCKHWHRGDCYRLELSRPDDYCSYGERKDGDNNATD